jgi:hypothetical protein
MKSTINPTGGIHMRRITILIITTALALAFASAASAASTLSLRAAHRATSQLVGDRTVAKTLFNSTRFEGQIKTARGYTGRCEHLGSAKAICHVRLLGQTARGPVLIKRRVLAERIAAGVMTTVLVR